MHDDERPMYELEFPAPEVTNTPTTGPTLIVALQGFADAGHAVEDSAEHLKAALETRPIASFNNDELIDYRSRRPAVTIDHNQIADVEDISISMDAARDTNGSSFLLLSGPEPDMRWEGFTQSVADLADKFGVERTICLYGAPMAVPHTRPMVVSGHGSSRELIKDMFTFDSRLILPGSASMMIEQELAKRGIEVAGFTAHVPHYLAQSSYPEATLKLLASVAKVSGLSFPLGALEGDVERVREQLEEQYNESAEVQQIVNNLEAAYDEQVEHFRNQQALSPGDAPVPSGDEIGEEFERFLAQLDSEGEDGDEPNGEGNGEDKL